MIHYRNNDVPMVMLLFCEDHINRNCKGYTRRFSMSMPLEQWEHLRGAS